MYNLHVQPMYNLHVQYVFPTYFTFKHIRYIQQLEIWATALLEEISNIDKFFIFLWMFVYSKETISITVEPRYNETLYNEVQYNKQFYLILPGFV